MTDPEDFLSRWSRRKREAKVGPDQPERDRAVAPDQAKPDESPQPQAPVRASAASPRDAAADDVFDLSKLPSLDSIGAATDIRMFLQPGVPEALSRAALRRAWSADPGIRDFIGLAENAWDFTASDGMHGFGALDPADAKRLLAELFREGGDKTDIAANDAAAQDGRHEAGNVTEQPASDSSEATSARADDEAADPGEPEAADDVAMLRSNNSVPASLALHQNQTEIVPHAPLVRRAHGRALPE
jgi:hypothetical protein